MGGGHDREKELQDRGIEWPRVAQRQTVMEIKVRKKQTNSGSIT